MVASRMKFWLFLVTLCILVSLSCNLPFADEEISATRTPIPPVNATEIAQTVIAGLTVPVITLTNTIPPEPPSAVTRTPSQTAEPPTVTPTLTLTTRPCNQATFLADVNIADGTEIQTNTNFTKTWRLQNNGSCTWTSGYHVIFDTGDRMNAPDAVAVTGGTIPYGGSVEVSVALKAPGAAGTYKGNFRLRSPDGVVFGIGGGVPFYVQIVAVAPGADPVVEEPPVLPPPVAGKPDLIITDITFDPPILKKGQPVTVRVSTYNQGNAVSGPFTVKWWPGELYGDNLTHTWNVDNNNPGGGKVLSFVYAGYPSVYLPSITTKAVVDVGTSVEESNEGNNTMKKNVTVPN
ncbi:MAG: NBR1-Ig-like domain-containing protein [Leptolinea sp.]